MYFNPLSSAKSNYIAFVLCNANLVDVVQSYVPHLRYEDGTALSDTHMTGITNALYSVRTCLATALTSWNYTITYAELDRATELVKARMCTTPDFLLAVQTSNTQLKDATLTNGRKVQVIDYINVAIQNVRKIFDLCPGTSQVAVLCYNLKDTADRMMAHSQQH